MKRHPFRHQRGAALAIALILLVIITVLSLSGIRFTALDNRMALNQELRIESMQRAQSVLDSVISVDSNIVVQGNAGFTNCTPGIANCNQSSIQLPAFNWADTTADQMRAQVVMTGDGEAPPRLAARLGSSLPKLRASSFEVVAEYNRADQNEARSEVGQGMILIYGRSQ
jgi:Tfp pilus assembly protein PilX